VFRTFCTAAPHQELSFIWLSPTTPTSLQLPYGASNGVLFGGIFDPSFAELGEENGSPDPWTIWLRTNPRFKLEPQGRLPSCSSTKRMELGARVESAFLNLKGDF